MFHIRVVSVKVLVIIQPESKQESIIYLDIKDYIKVNYLYESAYGRKDNGMLR